MSIRSFIVHLAASALGLLAATGAHAQLGQWCGLSTINAGNYPAIWLNSSTANAVTLCQGHNPQNSCPRGYSRLAFAMTAWHADSSADWVSTCVEDAPVGRVAARTGEWCGLDIQNPGNRPSAFLDGATAGSVACDGHLPSRSCPRGFDQLRMAMTSWHDDSTADSVYTCVSRNRRPDGGDLSGQWCGVSTQNSGTYPSIYAAPQASCLGMNPVQGCPDGFRQLHFCMTAWHADSIADCVTSCVLDGRGGFRR